MIPEGCCFEWLHQRPCCSLSNIEQIVGFFGGYSYYKWRKKMFRKCVILIVFLSVIITACKSQTIPEPTLTPINTVVPTLAPTPAPTAISTPTRRELAEQYFLRGLKYVDKGEWDLAIEEYSEAIAIDPEFVEAYYNRGNAYYDKGNLDLAISDYDKAIELDPEDPSAYFNRGMVYGFKGNLDRAINDFDKAIELDPEDADAYYNRGLAYDIMGDLDHAIVDYDKAIELSPEDPEFYNNRGNAYDNKGYFDHAISDYDKAIELDPLAAKPYYNRAIAYYFNEDYELAINDFNKSIELEPEYVDAYFYRGLVYVDLFETENAVADLKKAIEIGLGPDDEEYALTTLDELSSLPAVRIFLGETSQGEKYSFKVEDGEITALEVGFDIPGCETYSPYAQLYVNYPIDENTISIINTNLEIKGSFDSPDSASGSMRIHPAICNGEVDVTWSASTNFVPPVVNIPERALPEMEIPEGLFIPEAGDDKFYQPGISSQGDWFLYTSGMESMLPIPAGWSTNETGQETHIIFFEKGRPDEPTIFIRLVIIPEFNGGTDPSTATINEFSDNLKALDVHKILAAETLDDDKGYILANLNHESNTSEMMLLFTSRSMNNPSGPFTHLFAAYSATADWDGYYPIVRAMLEKWFTLDSTPLGAQLPESLNE
jgi:tetratricopeptide (TPR) repeat protein